MKSFTCRICEKRVFITDVTNKNRCGLCGKIICIDCLIAGLCLDCHIESKAFDEVLKYDTA